MLTCVLPVLPLKVPSREASCTRTLIFTAEKSETIPATTCHLRLRRTLRPPAPNRRTIYVHPAHRLWAEAEARSRHPGFAAPPPSPTTRPEKRPPATALNVS